MSGSDEVKEYLRVLLDHNAECGVEACVSCFILDRVCEQLRHQIFSSPLLPEILTPVTSGASSHH
ncbi:MAG TPA: hypothetical protein VGZ73_26630 [Bryobacteraceae bacterium]|jgi:hypothetical protein|nr:hypothetical protein [Bryobacteraceae bacterium]